MAQHQNAKSVNFEISNFDFFSDNNADGTFSLLKQCINTSGVTEHRTFFFLQIPRKSLLEDFSSIFPMRRLSNLLDMANNTAKEEYA